jgi:hypothetical protein
MRLDDLLLAMRGLDIPRFGEPKRPSRESVRSVQQWMAAALGDDEFSVDCIDRELSSMAERPARGELEPFFVDPESGARFAFAYWAPGRAAGAHEHNDWTVTAVVHNRLDVETYDFAVARKDRTLEVKNLHRAERGRAGYIYEPCIHNPRNPTPSWSMSIHIISPNDRPCLERDVGPISGLRTVGRPSETDPEDPFLDLFRAKTHERAYRVQAEVLCGHHSERATKLLLRIYRRGDCETRRIVALAMSARNPSAAAQWLEQARALDVGLDAELVRAWPAIQLSVAYNDSQIELVSVRDERLRVLLRADSRAAEALMFAARRREFCVHELPGDLGSTDQVALARSLVELGLFQVVPKRAGARERIAQ